MSQLKYCPHCGLTKSLSIERNDEYEEEDRAENDWRWKIVCDVHDGGCGSSSGFHRSVEDAEAAWNQRASDPSADEASEQTDSYGNPVAGG